MKIKEHHSTEHDRNYDDIINLPHHISAVHPPMSVINRAAQFLPFAALTGYDDAIRETGRLTDAQLELEEDAICALDGKLHILEERLTERPEISVTYFRPDARKAGGAYVTVTGRIKRIDCYERVLCMENGSKIPMEAVVEMEGEIFSSLEK